MDANRWKQIDELVDAALDVPESERSAFIASRAADDDELKQAALDLLDAQKESDSFMQRSAMRIAADALADAETEVSSFAFINKTIATYRIEKLLGVGGMGEVYLAFDQKLKRKVALKILPPEYGSNDERVKRFEMEARAISSLNHPGIVTVFDVGNFEGVNYIATEFVEGKTLRELMGERFKLTNILANSIQICDALSAAHASGIVHRDIKPENIMIRTDGYAKILDFGLAKLTDVGPESLADMAATRKGTMIGTPAYMSPAQISGESIDHRTDIWSCGVVLYEFLTGTNPFRGANRQETFQAILSAEPRPVSSEVQELPPEMDAILAKALAKTPDLGYQSAADLRADLKQILRQIDHYDSDSLSGSASRKAIGMRSSLAELALAGTASALLTVAAIWFLAQPPVSARIEGADWKLAAVTQLTNDPGTEFYPSISPDGSNYVYSAKVNGTWDILLKRVGGSNAQNLTPDSQATDTQPAFSPTGDRIAFRSERNGSGIYVMEATGENPRRITDFGFHPAWSPDGNRLAVSTTGHDLPDTRNSIKSEIWIVDIASGEKRLLTGADAMQPSWSPDGRFIAYWLMPEASGRRDVAVIPAEGGEPSVITGDGTTNWNPVWSHDSRFLYYASDRRGSMQFWRVEIGETGNALGEPEAVTTPSKYVRHLTFSRDGKRLMFVSTDNRSNIQGIKFDPKSMLTAGDAFWITKGDREVSRPDLSPDGTRFVYRMPRRDQDDIVTIDAEGANQRDVTDDSFFDRYPRWSPDGRKVVFTSDRNGGYDIYTINADGTGLERVTTNSGGATFPLWSPDGNRLMYRLNRRHYVVDLTAPLEGQQHSFITSDEDQTSRFVAWDWSPDGLKLAGTFSGLPMRVGYFSFEKEAYFPLAEATSFPRWLPDSQNILFGSEDAVSIVDIASGKVTKLFQPTGKLSDLGVSEDGKLIYFVIREEESDIWLLDLTAN